MGSYQVGFGVYIYKCIILRRGGKMGVNGGYVRDVQGLSV